LHQTLFRASRLAGGPNTSLVYSPLGQIEGIEPSSFAWQARIITIIPYLHGLRGVNRTPVSPPQTARLATRPHRVLFN
jgi:hypothetical protein